MVRFLNAEQLETCLMVKWGTEGKALLVKDEDKIIQNKKKKKVIQLKIYNIYELFVDVGFP